MRAPAHDAGHREDGRVQFHRNADHLVDEAGVEVQVRADRAAGGMHLGNAGQAPLLDALQELELLHVALLRGNLARHALQRHGAGIAQRVHGVPQAIDEPGMVVRLASEHPHEVLVDLLVVFPILDHAPQVLEHVGHHHVGAAVQATLQGADARGDGRVDVRLRGTRDAHGERGVVTATVLRLRNHQQIKHSRFHRRIIAAEHPEEVLRQRQALFRVSDVEALALHRVPVAIVRVGDNRRKLRDQIDRLAHLVVAGDFLGGGVEGVHLQHAAGEDVHDVGAFQVDDVHQRPVVQGHPRVQEFREGLQFLAVGEFAGEQQVRGLLVAEALAILQDGPREVLEFVTAVVKAALDGLRAAIGLALITHDIADVREPHQHAGAVLVAEAPLHAVLGEQRAVDAAGHLHLVGEFVH